ncbi:glycosyltransferase family 4 protein [Aurantimonas sp. C2-6-R+9]|uniref:glycosyltransferase family 4 protein n=1 Tax=unclassified Aurantimonas TaxID=2638230 RepID=UPI002E174A03|nr:glycosyltransferase family 4 protein [Aurantimonas sp. C2-6-R+9]
MIEVLYISPSALPSRTANSVHVVHQCAGLKAAGADVTLVAHRTVRRAADLPKAVAGAYGVDPEAMRLASVHNPFPFGDQILITARALARLIAGPRPNVILSRNLYASWLFACVLGRPILFETHQLEPGFRRRLQRAVSTRPHVTTIVISRELEALLAEHLGVAPTRTVVLHDAAPDGLAPLPAEQKRPVLGKIVGRDLTDFAATAGYFGQLYAGRGIEIIEAVARKRPDMVFLVFGGSEHDIAVRRTENAGANVVYAGFVPHGTARAAMAACDILLMPYQSSVSIGVAGHDTARWMSPMKMFEYLGSGSAVVSSDLPVLREVLEDGRTALLAAPDDVDAWLERLDRLVADPTLRATIGAAAHESYRRAHTWSRRAEAILIAGAALWEAK